MRRWLEGEEEDNEHHLSLKGRSWGQKRIIPLNLKTQMVLSSADITWSRLASQTELSIQEAQKLNQLYMESLVSVCSTLLKIQVAIKEIMLGN